MSEQPVETVKVQAIKRGHYIKLREVGDVFDFPKSRKLGSWIKLFVQTEGDRRIVLTERKKPGPKPKAMSELHQPPAPSASSE